MAEKPYDYLQEKKLIDPADVTLKDFIRGMRFAAHIAVFAILGILLVMACNLSFRRFSVVPAVLIGISIAVISEVVKLRIAGRHCDWFEASVNVTSCLAGITLAFGVRLLFRRVSMHMCLRSRHRDDK